MECENLVMLSTLATIEVIFLAVCLYYDIRNKEFNSLKTWITMNSIIFVFISIIFFFDWFWCE